MRDSIIQRERDDAPCARETRDDESQLPFWYGGGSITSKNRIKMSKAVVTVF